MRDWPRANGDAPGGHKISHGHKAFAKSSMAFVQLVLQGKKASDSTSEEAMDLGVICREKTLTRSSARLPFWNYRVL